MRRLLIAVVLLTISASLALGARGSIEAPNQRPRAVQDPSRSAPPVVPGKIGMIAYAAFDPASGQTDVFNINPDGSHRRQLTTTGGDDPVWSPDGTEIAFERGEAIWLMDALGGSQRRLVNGTNAAWAPDGRRLSYACPTGAGTSAPSTCVTTRRASWWATPTTGRESLTRRGLRTVPGSHSLGSAPRRMPNTSMPRSCSA
ncbi:hypothetical protein DDE18_21640 [Nocardioides gansuensis]|uniref:Dipeptidylpeptidase IV N-terminal domain-containing protein n=1 Tax=Nocardioides gansuensis TaxID=2138300 RepID=A0A2T8F4Y2_9ACTN|nr:hypothetical protein DDE18_21640 [Nocardioides gansuensis]